MATVESGGPLPVVAAGSAACADTCQDTCAGSSAAPGSSAAGSALAGGDVATRRAAIRWVLALSWFSLLWMTGEGVLGLWSGWQAHSVSLVAWALGSAVEGLAGVIVIWRFTGGRHLSATAERHAQQGVAVSFWLLACGIAAESVRDLLGTPAVETSVLGVVVTSASLVVMPGLGVVKRRLGARLGSGATAGEGTQNLLCAAQAGAVLIGLVVHAVTGISWLDPVIGLVLAAWSVREGRQVWRGQDCC